MIPLLFAFLLAADPQPAAMAKREWSCQSLPHFRICATRDLQSSSDLRFLKSRAEPALREMLGFFGASTYPHRVYVFLVRSPRSLQLLNGVAAKGSSRPEEHAVFLALGYTSEFVHELNHEIATGLWGKSEYWVAEGLAAWAAAPNEIDAQCRQSFADRWALMLSDMVKPEWNAAQDPYPPRAIYPMLGSFVKYLKTTYGLDALRRVWRGGSQSIPAVFGKPLADLESEWREALARTSPKP